MNSAIQLRRDSMAGIVRADHPRSYPSSGRAVGGSTVGLAVLTWGGLWNVRSTKRL